MISDNDQQALTSTGEAIAEIWRGLFGVTELGGDDDFFGLGGNSLTAIKFLARVEERFGEDTLLPETLYDDARLASLAKAIDEATAAAASA
jgi:Phosphopantetheine attachment site